jgi:hypothetical protein
MVYPPPSTTIDICGVSHHTNAHYAALAERLEDLGTAPIDHLTVRLPSKTFFRQLTGKAKVPTCYREVYERVVVALLGLDVGHIDYELAAPTL